MHSLVYAPISKLLICPHIFFSTRKKKMYPSQNKFSTFGASEMHIWEGNTLLCCIGLYSERHLSFVSRALQANNTSVTIIKNYATHLQTLSSLLTWALLPMLYNYCLIRPNPPLNFLNSKSGSLVAPATFQEIHSYMWLVANVLDDEDTELSSSKKFYRTALYLESRRGFIHLSTGLQFLTVVSLLSTLYLVNLCKKNYKSYYLLMLIKHLLLHCKSLKMHLNNYISS